MARFQYICRGWRRQMSGLIGLALVTAMMIDGDRAIAKGTFAVNTLCEDSETPVFSCVLRKTAKVASVCRNGAALYYRFGRSNRIELKYPEKPAPAQGLFVHLHWGGGGSGGGENNDELTFTNAGVTYSVSEHDTWEGGHSATEKTASVNVRLPGKGRPVTLMCEKFDADWSLLSGIVEEREGE